MIKIDKTEVVGWEHAIRGLRNPMNSWERSDSVKEIPDDALYCDNLQTGEGTVILKKDKVY